MNLLKAETAKYAAVWQHPKYEEHSPAVEHLDLFLKTARPGHTIMDIGCGKAEAAVRLTGMGHRVCCVDIVDVRCDEAKGYKFVRKPAWQLQPNTAGWWDDAFCCDVMEHIPTEYVMLSLERILSCCGHGFFTIGTMPDSLGRLIGKPLHLTVRPHQWWKDRLGDFGDVVEARDLLSHSVFYVR